MTDNEKGLTVEAACERLAAIAARSRGDQHLVVAYDPGYATMGGTPVKYVKSISAGIDWDRGKVFLDLGSRLLAPSSEQEKNKALLRKTIDTIGFIDLALRNKHLTPEARLKSIEATLQHFKKDSREG